MYSAWCGMCFLILWLVSDHPTRNWRTQAIHFAQKEPAALAWKQPNPISPRMLLRTMGRVLEGRLGELSAQNMQVCVVRWHTLHPKPEPKSITTSQDKAHSHVLFSLMPLKERPQPVVPKYDLKNLFVMVLLPGFCQGGIGGTVCPGVTRSPLDYFCFPAKSSPKLPQRRKTRTLSLHSCPQMKMETCLSRSTRAAH